LRIKTLEACERLINRHKVDCRVDRGSKRIPETLATLPSVLAECCGRLIKTHGFDARTALRCLLAARVIDEDPAHQLRCKPEELPATLPLHVLLIDEPQKGFVHERRALQGVFGALAPQVLLRHVPQLLVNERHQLTEGGLIAGTPFNQQLRNAIV
jgi:hypothetical protein